MNLEKEYSFRGALQTEKLGQWNYHEHLPVGKQNCSSLRSNWSTFAYQSESK